MICALSIGFVIFLLPVQRTTAQGTLSIAYYGDPSCPTCIILKGVVEDFVMAHPDVSATYTMANYYTNTTRMEELKAYYATFGLTITAVPVAVLNDSRTLQVLYAENLDANSLQLWYIGALQGSITLWGTFLLGLAFGGSTCLLLILSLLGATLVTVSERKKYLAISIGLVLGLIAAYTVITIIFNALLIAFSLYTNSIVYILDVILLFIGVWQIIEFKKEKSIIFGTPTRVKSWLKTFITNQTGISAFFLGVLFALVKIPCIGGVFLQIITNTSNNPLFIYFILLYYAGMILPVVALLIGFRVGLQSEQIKTFLEKNRRYLRLMSGIVLIALTLYLLISNIQAVVQ